MELAEFYHVEALRRQAHVVGRPDLAAQYGNELFQRTHHIPHFQFPNSLAFDEVFQTYISGEMIKAISKADPSRFESEIAPAENQCRSYVERLLDVDLTKVEIVRVEGDYEKAEGKAVSCGATDHIVLLPPEGEGLVSPDLLVHELGHTGEFTLRRASNDVEMLRSHKLLSKAIAHYCQYKYLLEFGTEDARLNALGSVTAEHLLLRALAASFTLPDRPSTLQVEQILDSEELEDYRYSYSRAQLAYILAPYNHQSIQNLYYLTAEPRMGAILALHLINDCTAIRNLCKEKADRPVKKVLEDIGLNTAKVMDFTQADVLLKSFVKGTC